MGPTSPTTTHEKHNASTTIPRKSTIKPRLTLFFVYLVSFIFLILVEIGNTKNSTVLRSTFFFRIDLSNIVPQTIPNYQLVNSIARSIGLHDFYQVGLWNFCEGYNSEGITSCSKPHTLYWFNPVEILLNELLAGASIALPADINTALNLVRTASNYMFAFFLLGAVLTFLCIFLTPLNISSRPRYIHRGRRIFLRSLPLTLLALFAFFFTAVASVIATVMFVIFRNIITSQQDLNIGAEVGTQMLAFMWIATGLNMIGFLWDLGNCCAVCCCSGKKKARRKGLIDDHGNYIGGSEKHTSQIETGAGAGAEAGASTVGTSNPSTPTEAAAAASLPTNGKPAGGGGTGGIARMRRGFAGGWRSKRVERV